MKYFLLLMAIICFSCSAKHNGAAIDELETWLGENTNNYSYCVIMPGAGCEGCIMEGERFAQEYSGRSDILFVFTRIVSLKLLKTKLGERVIKHNNVLLDTENKFAEIDKGQNNIYPVVCFLKNNKVLDLYYLSPDQKQDIIGNLKKELDTKASITIDLAAYLKENTNKEIMLSKLVDSLEYVPLNTPHDLPVDILMSVKMSSDNIFVLDRQQNLFRFDRKGNFLNLIGGRGEGDKEYISVVNFEVDEQVGRVHLFDIYRKKIKTYDMAGNYHGEVPVPLGIENIALLNESCFIGYKPWYSVDDKMNQCVILDKQGKEINTIPFTRKQTDKEVEINLFRMPDFNHILSTSRFCLPFDNTIYFYSGNDKVNKDVQFELGKYLLPLECSMNVELYNQSLNSPYVFELNSCRMDNMVYISFFYQKKSYRLVYDVIQKTFYTAFVGSSPQGVANDLDGGANFWPLWFTSDKLIGMMTADMLDMEYEDVRVKDLYERLKKCDNPVLQIGSCLNDVQNH